MSQKLLDTILVVDDDQDIRNLTKLVLEEIGKYKAKTASDGYTALEMLKIWEPDLILMDLKMPHLDGTSTLKVIKREKQISHIPVIFFTGISIKLELNSLLEQGALGYLLKPYNPIEFCKEISLLFNKNPTMGESQNVTS